MQVGNLARYVKRVTNIETLSADVADLKTPSASTTAARPTPASAGVGGSLFDTTLNKPVWSDGVNWRDSAGVIA